MLRGSGVMAVACAAVARAGGAGGRGGGQAGGDDGRRGGDQRRHSDAHRHGRCQRPGDDASTSSTARRGRTAPLGRNPAPAADSARAAGARGGRRRGAAGRSPATTTGVVAFNRDGQARGRDRTFRTLRVPLGLSLAATPNPVIAGEPIDAVRHAVRARATPGGAIRLQATRSPTSLASTRSATQVVTDASGAFSFPILSLPGHHAVPGLRRRARPRSPAPPLTVGARRAGDHARRGAGRDRAALLVRFRGRIVPARDGVLVEIQRRRRAAQWRTVKRTIARHATASALALRARACGCAAAGSTACASTATASTSPTWAATCSCGCG